jgi:hypothetical protein
MGANRTDVKHIMTLATDNGHRRPLEYSKDEACFCPVWSVCILFVPYFDTFLVFILYRSVPAP